MNFRRLSAAAVGVTAAVAAVVPGVATGAAAGIAAAPAPAARGGVQPLMHIASSQVYATPPTTAQCIAEIGLACYSPQQFRAAYDMNSLYKQGFTGRGKTIVIVDSFGSPTIRTDLKNFNQSFGLPNPPKFDVIQPVGAVPPYDSSALRVNWAFETTLDVEYAHAMAPLANILLVETPVAETEGLGGIPEIVAAENYVINHGMGDVISQSFGATEETFPSPQAILNQRSAFINAAAHGVSVLAGSGDAGPTDYSNTAGTLLYTHRVNSWPSTDPLVTSVGGTQLHLDQAGRRAYPDVVWNDTNVLGSPAASGGGVSSVFGRPAYQNGVAAVVGSRRGTPDVSLTAAVDGAALVLLGFPGIAPGFHLVGGTSEATPIFAGIVAVADQAAGHDLGQLNPKLYGLGSGSAALPDVAIGNNTVTFAQQGKTFTVPGYLAGPGYDLATGLGTVDGAALVAKLAAK